MSVSQIYLPKSHEYKRQLVATPDDKPFGDPATLGWRSRVIANSGTVSGATVRAVDTFVKGCKIDGIWTLLDRINLFCGDQLAACLVPLKVGSGSATDVNTNFVAGDYTEATGLTGNGSSKVLDTGLQLTSPATGGMGVYLRALMNSGANKFPMGCSDGTNLYQVRQSTAPGYTGAWGGTNIITTIAGQMPVGSVHNNRSSSTRHDIYSNGVSTGNRVISTTPGTNGLSIFVFASNNSGVATNYIEVPLGGYWITASLDAAQTLAFAARMETFQDALSRGVV